MATSTPPIPYGAIISLARPQCSTAQVRAPVVVGATYALGLAEPLLPNGLAVALVASEGDTVTDIASALVDALTGGQTVISVELGLDGRILLSGRLGIPFDVAVDPDLIAITLAWRAIMPMANGVPIGALRVIACENAFGTKPRHYWTREYPSGEVREVWRVTARELGSDRVFDLDTADVPTVLSM